ncbi:PREDICTED: PRUPE_8G042700 [Prunus dulcis]|uniref:PREDICTED: PRUPE_8G042700 n=1 Tax=Prunus dulcis TaxID=3755 RepID=A0A5E4GC23_PRUDU|nr:hypothetical protein L3X38_002881 [Prunus dulcis]VVA37203.1 PREDICTED: PRUPE_8G042700 [Prunus dulcis]
MKLADPLYLWPKPPLFWSPPTNGVVKINVDASWKPELHKASIGVILRGSSGAFAAGLACSFALLNQTVPSKLRVWLSWKDVILLSNKGTLETTNLAADHLAKLAMSRMSLSIWVNLPPSSLIGILDKDGLPCPPIHSA